MAETYQAGHVKRNPETGAVAIRTIFEDGVFPGVQGWLQATTNIGAHHRATADVEGWEDLHIPTPEAATTTPPANDPPSST